MNLHSLPALLASIVTFAIGAAVALREPQRARRLFAVFALAVATWLLASFVRATLSWEAAHAIALIFALPIPILAYRFLAVFVAEIAGEAGTSDRRMVVTPRWMIPVAAMFLLTILYTTIFGGVFQKHTRVFELSFGLYVFGGLFSAALVAHRAYLRTLGRTEKARLRYLFVGGLVAIALSAFDSLGAVGLHTPTTGYVFMVTYMYFVSQALFRHRLLDLNEVLGRMAVLGAFVLLLSTIYGLLVAWVPSEQGGLFFFNSIVASLVIFILFDPLRGVIEGQIQGWLFRERWALRAAIDRARGELSNTIELKDAVATTLRNLEDSRRVTHASVYLLDRDGTGFDLHGWIGPRPVERLDAAARHPLIERLTRGSPDARGGAIFSPVSIEQLERDATRRKPGASGDQETEDAIAFALYEMKAALCVPLVTPDAESAQVVGLLGVRDERLRDAFASDEIELLRGLSAQLAIAVKNSKLYERMKERDRLAALGEMAAGLAHEIRNPLGAIKGAAQLLAPGPGGEPVREASEFLDIIVEEANRLNRVVSQFLDYARPYAGKLDPLDLNEVLRKTIQLLPPVTEGAPPTETFLELGELPSVRGDAEQLRQVFLNLALNAVQAMPDGGKLTVTTVARPTNATVEVRFRDTGIGIAPSVMKNLFIPFFTTKQKGTGLGLPISQRIIESHGGRIDARSGDGAGATFTVTLPATREQA
jgi:two-component system, NtrC family, sensor histidine kinase HydH